MFVCREPFLAFIMEEAIRQTGRAFAPDSAEGRAMENPPGGFEVEDWSGWLVPPRRTRGHYSRICRTGRWQRPVCVGDVAPQG